MKQKPDIESDDVELYLQRRADASIIARGSEIGFNRTAFMLGWAESMIARIARGETTPAKLREELKR